MVTKELLSQYTSLLKEREEIETSIERLEKRIAKMESEGTVIDSVKGGFGGIQRFVIEGFPNDDIEIRRGLLRIRKNHLELLNNRILAQINEIEAFMWSIPNNSPIRMIVRLRYIENLQWDEVASRFGAGYSEDAVKKMFYRYIEKENQKETVKN